MLLCGLSSYKGFAVKTLGIKRSNFRKLETLDYKDIIDEVTPIPSKRALIHHGPNVSVQAKRIKFKLHLEIPPLYCVEYIDNASGEIIEYHYDWEDSSGILMKFHAHYHPEEAPASVKQFDPFHLHVKIDGNDKEARKREPDTQYKCLYNVLYFIKSHAYVKAYTGK
ncbi:DUF6516 family protein [Bacillus sp. DNRA2]|uniref:toxin-antitoxin system TumE family protein n=1 Tax=Bacillus sp. DNRA2 TaxID=2723053 RepID=UPI002006ED67|nr:DUF6516 family protein [Bacillus sp. DNRA2]